MNTDKLNQARKHYMALRQELSYINTIANTNPNSGFCKRFKGKLFGKLNRARAALRREIKAVEQSLYYRPLVDAGESVCERQASIEKHKETTQSADSACFV